MDPVVDLSQGWVRAEERARRGETRLKRVGTESNTLGLMIATASRISSLLGQRAMAEP
jgi:hypothetical protein